MMTIRDYKRAESLEAHILESFIGEQFPHPVRKALCRGGKLVLRRA